LTHTESTFPSLCQKLLKLISLTAECAAVIAQWHCHCQYEISSLLLSYGPSASFTTDRLGLSLYCRFFNECTPDNDTGTVAAKKLYYERSTLLLSIAELTLIILKLHKVGITVRFTSISANADGPRDAASQKIDHITLPTKYNYQATSVG